MSRFVFTAGTYLMQVPFPVLMMSGSTTYAPVRSACHSTVAGHRAGSLQIMTLACNKSLLKRRKNLFSTHSCSNDCLEHVVKHTEPRRMSRVGGDPPSIRKVARRRFRILACSSSTIFRLREATASSKPQSSSCCNRRPSSAACIFLVSACLRHLFSKVFKLCGHGSQKQTT